MSEGRSLSKTDLLICSGGLTDHCGDAIGKFETSGNSV